MAKEAKSESFQEKLKKIFKFGVRGPITCPDKEFALTTELLLELGPPTGEGMETITSIGGGPSSQASAGAGSDSRTHRMKLVKRLTAVVREQRLQEHGVELLWVKTKDLYETQDIEQRHDMLYFFEALVRGQYENLDVVRGHFFRIIKELPKEGHADLYLIPRIKLLDALTEQGKDILHFEDEMGPLLHKLFPAVIRAASAFACSNSQLKDETTTSSSSFQAFLLQYFLNLLLNVIKFNSAYLDPDVVCGLISYMSQICLLTDNSPDDVKACLQCMDAILCYTYIPKEALRGYICNLCIVVNMKEHCTEAWRITRNLMRTHLGHSALYCLCQIVQSGEGGGNVALVRGAVCFVGRSLWGEERIEQLDSYSPMTILPTFVHALNCDHPLVIYEVTLQVDRLVAKFCHELRATGCDAVLALVEMLLMAIPQKVQDLYMQRDMLCHVHNVISNLENLVAEKKYVGSQHRIYDVIDQCASQRPENSVMRLITYRSKEIYPTKLGWIRALNDLMERYFRQETRPNVRIKALNVMIEVLKSNRQIYEEELLDRVVLPHFATLDQEPYDSVSLEAIKALTRICIDSSSKRCTEILDILERIVARPLLLKTQDPSIKWSERRHDDVALVIYGLINVICEKVCQQSAFIVERAYTIIARHLEANYDNPDVFGHTGAIRNQIFRLFMRMRANQSFHFGIEKEEFDEITSDGLRSKEVVHFSPFLICRQPGIKTKRERNASSASGNSSIAATSIIDIPKSVTYISLTKACLMVIRCLSAERDWQVLKLVLAKVPSVLQNKAILSQYGTALQGFVDPLLELTKANSKYPECLTNIQLPKFSRSEFQNHIYPVIAAMAPYNEYLESTTTRALINALQTGLLSRECNRICIVALTACALEMRKSMYAKIPEVLLNFTKISPTKLIATPMLEFLSTLIRLPDIFSSFTDTHYMYVFAIALPFTNPFKFDPYTVSLAHHVIVMWFLKCRLAYRQNFVQFIISGLNSNVLSNFEEGGFRRGAATMTGRTSQAAQAAAMAASRLKKTVMPDSQQNTTHYRQRSSSFTDTPVKGTLNSGRDRHPTGGASGTSSGVLEGSMNKMMTFHQELSETCIDLLARYMFANASVKPKRLPTAEFLLKGGQSASWILGTMIITVTTSICDQTSSRGDLCDRCYLICRANPKPGACGVQVPENRDSSGGNRFTSASEIETPSNEEMSQNSEAGDGISRRRHVSDYVGSSPVKSQVSRNDPGATYSGGLERRVSVSDERLMPIDSLQGGGYKHDSVDAEEERMCELEKLMRRQKELSKKKPELCACWCSGWAEVHIRRPSGDVSWMCRIQNSSLTSESHADIPLTDLTALFHPSMEPSDIDRWYLDQDNDTQIESSTVEECENDSKLQQQSGNIGIAEVPHQENSGYGFTNDNIQSRSEQASGRSEVNSSAIGVNTQEQASRSKAGDEPEVSKNAGGGQRQSCDPILEVEEGDRMAAATELRPRAQQLQLSAKTLKNPVSNTNNSGPSSPEKSKHTVNQSKRPESNPEIQSAINQSLKSELVKTESCDGPRRQSVFPGEVGNLENVVNHTQRDRAHTISGTIRAPLSRQLGIAGSGQNRPGVIGPGALITEHKAERVTGISPQFVFLTLYHSYGFGRMQTGDITRGLGSGSVQQAEKPLLLPQTKGIEMGIKTLDHIHAHETHKIGVIYVGPGQAHDEQLILSNVFGSLRYADFLHGLGTLIPLRDIDKSCTFLGGLSAEDGDGEFTYMWEDDVMQVIFHVATMMPNRDNDPKYSKKKRHIGNDYVALVYNEAGDGSNYKLGTVKGQFIYACVVITPLDQGSNRVEIVCRPALNEPLGHVKEPKIVSDRNLAILVRQLALHCNLAAQIEQTVGSQRDPYASKRDPYASNWLERLRQIKRIRVRAIEENDAMEERGSGKQKKQKQPASNDFTLAVLRKKDPTEPT